ncbi:FAD-dependent oxidoreductase [Aggregatimonas sangjinii]|uniref:FAD-dependent oxidoreductase n=1 Tax=Aggregatimonas sangjinii TaxID=2583587 RepID=A0A5B7SSW6_9FLAO|nr:NAD(P)/FAD-dependent oxidoreductase [Aggregatimonas sangjinii]QCX00071.1 FAD-dependent oxidoreductase [Aggregatimonas sangjinii]
MHKTEVAIIGAGLSGLVAAICLEKAGCTPVVYEAGNEVGGRVRTDEVDGIPLDHGFQVLLTDYPLTRKYLDYEKLELRRFLPGAILFQNGKKGAIGDPLRNTSFLLPTLFSNAAGLMDKWRIFRLSSDLKKKELRTIFSGVEETTLQYLEKYGFSDRVIARFFKPFFSGIFLEDELSTSSKMFRFVYKMFASGDAAIPKKGMQEIPKQLFGSLQHTKFHFNTRIHRIDGKTLYLDEDKSVAYDYVIIATDPTPLLQELKPSPVRWHSTQTLYFKCAKSTIGKPIIGLVGGGETLVNNIHYVTDLLSAKHPEAVLSVTIVKSHTLTDAALEKQVRKELLEECGIDGLTFLRSYKIAKALPNLQSPTYDSRIIKYSDSIFLAGDHLANGSINAAMRSGELAAQTLLEEVKTTR